MGRKQVDSAWLKAGRWLGAVGITGIIIERGWHRSEPLFWIGAWMVAAAVILAFSAVEED